MTTDLPLVSIGLPVYNGEKHISEAIDSLLGQDYPNIELIISDNASTDGTAAICQAYAKRDPRVRYHRNARNIGAIKNFNHVFSLARGEYFMWAGDHDIRAPNYVSACAKVLREDPSVVLCYTQTVRVDPDGTQSEIIPPRLDTRGLANTTRLQLVMWSLEYCYQVYGLHRSEALRRTRLFADSFGPDTVLLAELALLGSFAYVPELLFYMRRTPDSSDWVRYAARLNKRLTLWTVLPFYASMTIAHLGVVNRHVPQLHRKFMLMFSVLTCIPIRYRNVLRAMLRQVWQQRR